MSPWLKAGLVGAAILAVLNLVGLIPGVVCVTCILGIFALQVSAPWLPIGCLPFARRAPQLGKVHWQR